MKSFLGFKNFKDYVDHYLSVKMLPVLTLTGIVSILAGGWNIIKSSFQKEGIIRNITIIIIGVILLFIPKVYKKIIKKF